MCLPFVTGGEFGVVANSPDDQTDQIKAMLNSLKGNGGLVWLGPGTHKVTTFPLPRGVELRGIGVAPWGTVLEQFDGVNDSMITHEEGLPENEWQHWGGVSHMRIIKAPGSTDTIGHGIFIDRAVGENFRCHDLLISGFPQCGLRYGRGGTPVWLDHLHLFGNKEYGLSFEKASGTRLQNCHVSHISADNNKLGVMFFKGLGDPSENIHIDHVKSETTFADWQPCVVHLDHTFNIGIHVSHVAGHVGGAALPTVEGVVKITGQFSGARVYLTNATVGGMVAVKHGAYEIPGSAAYRGATVLHTVGSYIHNW